VLKTPLLVATALAIAFGGGIWSSLRALEATQSLGSLRIGAWETNPLAQTEAADPYAKALRARNGTFALGQAEGLVFRSETDSTGQPLRRDCAYRIEGRFPPARLWVLQLTDGEGSSLSLPAPFSSSLHGQAILRAADGTFTIALDGRARAGNWLKLEGEGAFAVRVTLFDTPAAGSFGLVDLAMPDIERLSCTTAQREGADA
jgi:hypothetical protein